MCLSEGLCSAMSNDVRQAAAALLALGTNLETFDCSIQALSEPGPSFTQIYSDCLMPQDFSGDAPGLVHLHDTIISCTEECRNRGELSSGIPTVELSTGDSRQVVAALTNLALESMHLKIKLLDSLSIASNILSGPISIHVERHGSILSIDGLLDGNILAHMIFKTEGVIFIASTGFRVELMNMVLVMNWFGPGLFSKEIGIFPTCDEDEYIFKWPLFFPHLLFLEGSSLLIANTSMVYKECPYNLDFDEFIASLLMFKETAGARDYGDIYVAEPEIDVQKIGNIGIFFKKLTLELISLSRDSSNGTYTYTGAKVRVEVQNSNVVCESFGRRVIDSPRCAGESNDSKTEETGKAEIGKTMTRSAAMFNKCKGASFLTIALLLFQMGF
ncbi:hypothetical protein BSKO_10161 [Bryopsis sp. KO-2023]|nr:hypothetical protein BSKO_10161 [Bryopsis sp. KO-2023]